MVNLRRVLCLECTSDIARIIIHQAYFRYKSPLPRSPKVDQLQRNSIVTPLVKTFKYRKIDSLKLCSIGEKSSYSNVQADIVNNIILKQHLSFQFHHHRVHKSSESELIGLGGSVARNYFMLGRVGRRF